MKDQSPSSIRRLALLACGSVWICALTIGWRSLWRYETAAGAVAEAPATWPQTAKIARRRDGHVLVMTAHPCCPCTRASIGELAVLMQEAKERLDAVVLFYVPADSHESWARTGLWRDARQIPRTSACADPDGTDARKFGAVTSGQVLLYDPRGRLVFRGGITAARGHSGPSAGRMAILDIVSGRSPLIAESPVYGCELFASSAQEAPEVK